MASVVSAETQQPRWGVWSGAWGVGSFNCCTPASVNASLGADTAEEVDEPADCGFKVVDAQASASMTPSTTADTAAASPASDRSDHEPGSLPCILGLSPVRSKDAPGGAMGAWEWSPSGYSRLGSPTAEAARGADAANGAELIRTASFEVDHSELPELCIPEKEQPLVSGHLDARFDDIATTIFRHVDSPFDSFLCGDMDCFDMFSSPFVEETEGVADTTVQRSVYQLPLPADIPEIVARLLGLGKSVKSTTFTRAVTSKGLITLQQISHTEGLLYSERMRVMNIHCLEEDPAGGVAWRTFTRIVWTKPLPWTHSFIVKFIDGRVKAETKINAPKLMRCIKDGAGEVGRLR